MEPGAWIAVGTLFVAMVLFITKAIPLEATALSIPVVLAVTGTIDPAEAALKGFGNTAVIALGAIFIISAGLQESGVATLMARLLQRLGGKDTGRLVLLIMVAACVLSGIMSNTATVAVLLPAVAVLGRRAGVSPSRLMMPLSYAAILGGTLTLVSTTPNLILSGELARLSNGTERLGMFEFFLVGAPIAAAGIAYMSYVGVRLLRDRSAQSKAEVRQRIASSYDLAGSLHKLRIRKSSPLIGQTIGQAGIGNRFELEIMQILRTGGLARRYHDARPGFSLAAGDILYVEGREESAQSLAEAEGIVLEPADREDVEQLLGRGITHAEVTLSPHFDGFGRTLRELNFRGRFGLTVHSLWRRGASVTDKVADLPLELGDALLVHGPYRKLLRLKQDEDYVLLAEASGAEDVRRAPVAILLVATALLPPVFGWLPLAVSALGSALLMVATGCVSLRTARRSVDFRILFLIIGTIPLGDALYQTGVAREVANALFPPDSSLSQFYVLGVLFLASAILSTTSNNAAAAVILAPVAFAAAGTSGVEVGKTFLAVAYGASCTFVLPFAHQCNMMVMGPGGYRTSDFARVGIGLSVVMTVTAVTLLAIL
jgi:di/tricarboxylate transporter